MAAVSFGGQWTAEKLEILRSYLNAYTTALEKQPFTLTYVDAFAGSGRWYSPADYGPDDYGDFHNLHDVHDGSPTIALKIENKPFDRFVFIEMDSSRAEQLRVLNADYPDRNIEVVTDDANIALPQFCYGMSQYERSVVFLDPFATQVYWNTVEAIARTEKIDCWILFPLSAVARLMPRKAEPNSKNAARLDHIFGGREHWRQDSYHPSPQPSLFDHEQGQERERGSKQIADAYRARLAEIFVKVAPTTRILKNSKNSPLFALFFAVSNKKGAEIAIRISNHILKRM